MIIINHQFKQHYVIKFILLIIIIINLILIIITFINQHFIHFQQSN